MSNTELANAEWFTPSRSNGQGECVEVAYLDCRRIGLRDTKHKGTGPVHVFTRDEWLPFIREVKDGAFDIL